MDAPLPSPSAPSADALLAQAPSIRALARGLLRDEHLVEDTVQETWLRFLRRGPRERVLTRSWIGQVARRLTIDGLRERSRRAARERSSARPEALPSVAEELANAEILRSVVEEVLALDEPYRTSVLLAYWRGWDARRIALETGAPLATVRSRLQRAHQKLRERLDRAHERDAWARARAAFGTREVAGPLTLLAMGAGAKLALGAIALAALLFLGWRSLGRAAPPPAGGGEVQPIAVGEPAEQADSDAHEAGTEERNEVGTAALAGGIRIAGRVVDLAYAELELSEKPTSDLELKVGLAPSEYGFRDSLASGQVRTSSDGRFDLVLADPGSRPLFVRVSAPADEEYRSLWFVAELDELPRELQFQRAAHGVLHGTVVDDRGEPLADARLFFDGRDSGIEAVSSRDGAFSLPRAQFFHGLEVELPGYALLDKDPPQPLDSGGWGPMRVRMGPEAAVRVSVLDGAGRGIPEARVRVELDRSEMSCLEIGESSFDNPSRSAVTDERGAATIPGLWAERKLTLSIDIGGEVFSCDSASGGELRLTEKDRQQGEPIVVPAGAVLELVARIMVERDLAGRVVHPGGSPVPLARVTVTDLGRGNDWWSRPTLARCETDGEGRFTASIRTAELVGPLRVAAEIPKRASDGGLQELGYANEPSGSSAAKGEVLLDPTDEEALLAIELVVQPTLSIDGVVLDAAGQPMASSGFGSRIWVVPAGQAFSKNRHAQHSVGEGGVFTIAGLAAGPYDLYVSEELEGFYGFENFLHRFPAVEAGARDVELRLSAKQAVTIRVRVSGGEAPQGVVLHRKLFPHDAQSLDAPRAAKLTRVSGASGWPAGTSFGFAGIGGASTPSGSFVDGYDGLEWLAGGEYALQPLEPGWYVIGLHAQGPEGEELWFPQSTPLLYFEPGEHVVEFELLPAGTLRGRVVGATTSEFLATTLADEAGASVPLATLAGYAKPEFVHDTSASGNFVLHHAPTGHFRLRAGTRDELARGEFRRELPIVIRSGENPPVEIRL